MKNHDRVWILLGFLAVGNEAAGNEWASTFGIAMVVTWLVSVVYDTYRILKLAKEQD